MEAAVARVHRLASAVTWTKRRVRCIVTENGLIGVDAGVEAHRVTAREPLNNRSRGLLPSILRGMKFLV